MECQEDVGESNLHFLLSYTCRDYTMSFHLSLPPPPTLALSPVVPGPFVLHFQLKLMPDAISVTVSSLENPQPPRQCSIVQFSHHASRPALRHGAHLSFAFPVYFWFWVSVSLEIRVCLHIQAHQAVPPEMRISSQDLVNEEKAPC